MKNLLEIGHKAVNLPRMQATPRYLIGSALGVGSEMPSQLISAPRHRRIIPYLYGRCVLESSIVITVGVEGKTFS